jgi:hypothetical protein
MRVKTLVLAGLALIGPCTPTIAQTSEFERVAYVTCREAQAMDEGRRRATAVFLAEHAARHRGVLMPDGERGTHLALMVRAGCTLSPDAHLFAVIDRVLVAESPRLPRR